MIHERLVQEYAFTGNYQRVKLYLQEARPRIAEELGTAPGELAGLHRRFEVIPGAQAQVDWGDEGRIHDGPPTEWVGRFVPWIAGGQAGARVLSRGDAGFPCSGGGLLS
ncbi:hypothetical protein [Streptomyces albogriseolus]